MSAYTPGPWQTGNAINCGKDLAICAGAIVVARVVGTGYPVGIGGSPESTANARLIAGAPRMEKALKLVFEALSDWKPEQLEAYGLMLAYRRVVGALDTIQS